jgi:CheY-like chemotaxis protein/two-component sensor histidine kinase
MSHEIRTPLNAIVGLAQVGLRTPNLSVAWPYFSQIQDSGRMLTTLINDVLDMAKIEAGKLRLEMRPIELRKVIERATKLVRPLAESKGLTLTVECSEYLPQAITGDDARLIQVLLNLLGNAVKFTERGEVRLAVTNTMTGSSGWLLLSVIDTGVGIGKDQMLRLFKPLEQGDVSTTRHFGGTGLGLTICQQIVEMMGGHIDLSSQPGVGSCFTVRLPIEVAKLTVVQTPPALDPHDSAGLRLAGVRVLAAEDDKVNQWVLRELLLQEGATCTIVERGDLALKLLATPQPFDIFITDLQMPGLNGYETTLGALKLRPQLPVIGLTAFAMPEDRAKCLAAGMFDHISKPIDVDVLVDTLKRTLDWATSEPIADSGPVPLMMPAKASAPVDWHFLEKSLRKPNSQIKFLNTFMANYADVPEKLRQLLKKGDQQEIQLLAHKVQGATGFLAAKSAQQLARAVEERILHTHTLPSDLVDGLAVTLDEVLKEVAARIESMTAPV